MSTAWAAWGKLIGYNWHNSIYWVLYRARDVLHFVPVLWRQQEPLQDQGVWLGEHSPSVLSTPSLPCSLSRDGKKKGGKARCGYSCSIREIGSESKQLPQGGRITSKSWEHKSLCSECLSVSPDGERQAPLPTPSSAADLQWELEPRRYLERHFYRRIPRAEGSEGGKPVGPLELLEASYSCSRDQQPSFPFPSLRTKWAAIFPASPLCFLLHLSLLADYYGNDHGPGTWYVHHWLCRITTGMSWQVTRVLELVVWLQNCCCFLGCHKREGLHVLMAERQTLHLSQNSLHMDLVKDVSIFPQKSSFVSLLVDVNHALVSFTLL